MNTFADHNQDMIYLQKTHSQVSRMVNSMLATMGVRPCVTTKLPVLRPWFWNLILLNLAAASCYFIAFFAATPQGCCACVGQVVVCRASSCTFQCFVRKVKNAHRRQTFCAGSQQFDLVSVRLLCSFGCKQLVGCCSRFCCCLLSCSDIADVALGCVLVG